MSLLGKIVAVAAFLGLVSTSAWTQDIFESEDLPSRRESSFRAKYRSIYSLDQPVKDQTTDFGLAEQDFSFSADVMGDMKEQLSLMTDLRFQEVRTGARLPDTAEPFPEELWDVRFGGLYRYTFDNGWMAGGLARIGSASDHPFSSEHVLVGEASAFLRIPVAEHDNWLFFLNWSNNRDFLNSIPIPAVEYWYQPSEAFRAIVGIPFNSIEAHPTEDWTLSFSYLMIRTIHALAGYRPVEPVQIYGGFDWASQRYLRENRPDYKDRLFYDEKRVRGGLLINLASHVTLDLTAGYAFDRVYFEGKKIENDQFNRVEVENGVFAWVALEIKFSREKDAAEIERERREGIRR